MLPVGIPSVAFDPQFKLKRTVNMTEGKFSDLSENEKENTNMLFRSAMGMTHILGKGL